MSARIYVGVFVLTFVLISFFFNDPASTEIYTLSLHDALPIFPDARARSAAVFAFEQAGLGRVSVLAGGRVDRSEEHTSELQSHSDLVCRLLLEKKKQPKMSNV